MVEALAGPILRSGGSENMMKTVAGLIKVDDMLNESMKTLRTLVEDQAKIISLLNGRVDELERQLKRITDGRP